MAIHKFLLKPGKGVRTIAATDIELITKDPSEELFELNDQIRNVNFSLQSRLNRYTLINSNSLLTIFGQTTINNNVSYKLGYKADAQDAEFRFTSVQGSLNTVKHVYINSETNNKIRFTAGQPAIQIIVPPGKLPSITGLGKTVHAQTLRTSTSQNLVYLTGDLDDENSSIGSSTGLEAINEGNGVGWRLKGRNPANYGNIGGGAVDLSNSSLASTEFGATGINSFVTGLNNRTIGERSVALGGRDNTMSGLDSGAFASQSAFVRAERGSAISVLSSTILGKGGVIISGFGNNIPSNVEDAVIISGRQCVPGAGANKSVIISGFLNGTRAENSVVIGGRNMLAYSYGEVAMGMYGTSYVATSTTGHDPNDRALSVGIGRGNASVARKDGLIVMKGGQVYFPGLTIAQIDNSSQGNIAASKEWVLSKVQTQTPDVLGNWVDLTLEADATANRARYRVKGDVVEIDIYGLRMNSILEASGKFAFLPSNIAPNIGGPNPADDATFYLTGLNISQGREICVLGIRGETGSSVNRYGMTIQKGIVNPTDFLVFYGQYKIL